MQNHPELLAAAADALQRYGLGTATSRGGYGEHPVYVALEEMAARYFGAEAALYYVTAYLGNTILLQGLRGEYDRIFMDDASHFSVRDSVQIAGVPVTSFRHLDPDDLAAQLRGQLRPGERPLVISDGVFPISGEIAPAPDYLRALAAYPGAILCLDDAHATGVLGDNGQGTAEYWKNRAEEAAPRRPQVIVTGLAEMMSAPFQGGAASVVSWTSLMGGPDLVVGGSEAARPSEEQAVLSALGVTGVRLYSAHTLSKALGCHGGIIAGDAELIGKLRANASAYVAHSPSPLPVAAAAVKALDLDPRRLNAAQPSLGECRTGPGGAALTWAGRWPTRRCRSSVWARGRGWTSPASRRSCSSGTSAWRTSPATAAPRPAARCGSRSLRRIAKRRLIGWWPRSGCWCRISFARSL